MEVVKRSNPTRELPVNYLKISSTELIDVIKKTFENPEETSLTIGNNYDDQFTILENTSEIESYAATISIPFTVKNASVELRVQEYAAYVKYSSEDQTAALALHNRLLEHRKNLRFFQNWAIAPIAFMVISAATYFTKESTLPAFVSLAAIAISIVAIICSFASISASKPSFRSTERLNLFQQNRDSIFMLLIGSGFTLLLSNSSRLFEWIQEYFK